MQTKSNFFSDNPDIAFHLNHRVNFDDPFAWMAPEEREATGITSGEELKRLSLECLDTIGEMCGTDIAPHAVEVEREPLRLVDGEVKIPARLAANIKKFVELGFPGFDTPAARGGMGLPVNAQWVGLEMAMRACPSSAMNVIWFSSIGHIIDMFAPENIKADIIPRLASGEWSGSMALTEPDAGSDLSALRTYGERQEDGSWRLTGSKRFITNGCGEVSLVLAMNKKGATGLNNLNLFVCLKKIDGKDNFKVTKLEEKVALHGSATCELNFDNSVAYLIGEENQGFQHMLVLMNGARIATGYQATGMMEGAWRLARDYAEQRKTWGKPIAHHELIAEKLLDMEVALKAMRSISYYTGNAYSLMAIGEHRLKGSDLSDSERKEIATRVSRLKRRVRRLTPLVKWYAGEKSVEHARTGLQIHGGYGFSTEYRAEWWLRESIILAIYEGTSQIQSLMCLKDTMKEVIKGPRRFIEKMLATRMKALRETDPLEKKLLQAKQIVDMAVVAILLKLVRSNTKATLSEMRPQDILRIVKTLKSDLAKMEDLTDALLHAERLCEMKALTALAECLVMDSRVDSSRAWIAQRFIAKALPRMTLLKTELESDEPVILERLGFFRDDESPRRPLVEPTEAMSAH